VSSTRDLDIASGDSNYEAKGSRIETIAHYDNAVGNNLTTAAEAK
jgi:hypothetical protein